MWTKGWRDRTWSALDQTWDLIVIGGGITGAGILREAARLGLRALLLEADDFASGTSSRSSKMVHGGLRYLANHQLRMTLASVHERERLLAEGRGLVNPVGNLMAFYDHDPMPGWVFGAGLALYDLMAFKWGHRYYDASDLRELCPYLSPEGLHGGYRYFDAQADDARLVLRVLLEAAGDGAQALNYARVTGLLRRQDGQACGVTVRDVAESNSSQGYREVALQAPLVINATGAWADDLRSQVGGRSRLRRLRGSHLVFPFARLPLTRTISVFHPQDGRPVFAFPWEGVTLIGTTDVDHGQNLETDPAISEQEVDYLLSVVQRVFPEQELSIEDVQATYSGVRAVIGTGKRNPSKESREHVLWSENGLLTVAGGKLTTFRRMALDALAFARSRLPEKAVPRLETGMRVLDPVQDDLLAEAALKPSTRLRLSGRYGACAQALIQSAQPGELDPVGTTPSLWAELRWAAHTEGVVHLPDLLLRRVRLGLLLPQGGIPLLPRIRQVVQAELGWDDARWEAETRDYSRLWADRYQVPGSNPRRSPAAG